MVDEDSDLGELLDPEDFPSLSSEPSPEGLNAAAASGGDYAWASAAILEDNLKFLWNNSFFFSMLM
jgi:hypothetical protein